VITTVIHLTKNSSIVRVFAAPLANVTVKQKPCLYCGSWKSVYCLMSYYQ